MKRVDLRERWSWQQGEEERKVDKNLVPLTNSS
jgi:hypothetical protein